MNRIAFQTGLGLVTLVMVDDVLISLSLNEEIKEVRYEACDKEKMPLLHKWKNVIEAYLEHGTEVVWPGDVLLQGSEFQKRVWQELSAIPYGKTCTYQELAERLGKPKASRAVANAIAKNPLPIAIPCHRVVRKDGRATKFLLGWSLKQKLIALEQSNC